MKNSYYFTYLKNIIFPCLLFSAITGIFTGAAIFGFKYLAEIIITNSAKIYAALHGKEWIMLIVVAIIPFISYGGYKLNTYAPNTKGGGIPTAIAILRGLITFRWLRNLLGTVVASLVTFAMGVPLGNEGPCVLMGTSIGKGVVSSVGKKNRAWNRYVMTGGASSGFAVATGAPVSGIFFALEEAHQRFSPMIIMVACSSVMFSMISAQTLATLTGHSLSMFEEWNLAVFTLKEIWVPVAIGIAIGLFSALFSKLYDIINHLMTQKLEKVKTYYKFAAIYLITLLMGYLSYDFISTGHGLIVKISEGKIVWYMLIAILLFRSVLTLFSNGAGLTGGLFIPILSLGAIISSLVAKGLIGLGLVGEEYYLTIVAIGIASSLASLIKTPITAIVFSLEALSGVSCLVYFIVAVTFSYLISEMFRVKSINESVIDAKLEEINEGKTQEVDDVFLTVQPGAFVIGKSIRDVFWPNNFFVLSITPAKQTAVVDKEGGKTIKAGDVLHVRFQTYDIKQTKQDIIALVGEQEIKGEKVEKI